MTNLNGRLKSILNDLEENIKNKEDLEYAKTKVFNLYNFFLEEITRIEDMSQKKITEILETQLEFEDRMKLLEKKLSNIEKEIYIEDEDDSNFEITCPYCNNEFSIEVNELNNEIECPECNNVIELDWGEECECGHSCNCEDDCNCDENCANHEDDEDM